MDKDGYRFTRYLVVDAFRLLLVEPDSTRVGWGVVRQVSPLQLTAVCPQCVTCSDDTACAVD